MLQDTQTALPTELADISLMNFDDWTLDDLVKYLEESKTGKKSKAKAHNPIYASEGGSIDDLLNYLRS
jgi:hypothetical protein